MSNGAGGAGRPVPATGGSATGGALAGGSAGAAHGGAPGEGSAAQGQDPSRHGLLAGPLGLVQAVGGAVSGATAIVKPGAAVAVATSFGFPLSLMLAVLLFLVIQSRLDHRDPKLRAAPLTGAELTVDFEEEEQL